MMSWPEVLADSVSGTLRFAAVLIAGVAAMVSIMGVIVGIGAPGSAPVRFGLIVSSIVALGGCVFLLETMNA